MTSQLFRIAAKELRYLVLSPIGWIILSVFFIQTGVDFFNKLDLNYRFALRGASSNSSFAELLFTHPRNGLFRAVISDMYLYIPLLTMAVFARELQSGSIKLFMSSPIRASEIVIGKYLAIMGFLLGFVALFLVFCAVTGVFVPHFDWPALLPGLLGVYLVACCYGAIGVFISSLTQYQVLAALVAMTVLFVFSNIARWFAAIPVLNEITFWLSINGRSNVLVSGLIGTQHVVYFIGIIAMFLGFTILRISNLRVRANRLVLGAKAFGVTGLVVLAGWALSQPQLRGFYDLTYDKRNTLSPESRALMARMEGPWTIKTYANFFDVNGSLAWPRSRIAERQRYDAYRQENHALSMEYTLYYGEAPSDAYFVKKYKDKGLSNDEVVKALATQYGVSTRSLQRLAQVEAHTTVDLAGEDYKTFRVMRWNGREAILRFFSDLKRYPDERTRAAALRQLLDGPARVGVLAGAGERSATLRGPWDMQKILTRRDDRFALINHGFDMVEIEPTDLISEEIDILLIADPRQDYPAPALQAISDYIEAGGDLLLLVEGTSAPFVDPLLAQLGLARGAAVTQSHKEGYPETLILAQMSGGILNAYWGKRNLSAPVGLPGAIALETMADSEGFKRTPILSARNVDRDRVHSTGGAVTLGYGLERTIGENRQRIVVIGDADIASTANAERQDPVTIRGIFDAFHWLTEGDYPVQRTGISPVDNELTIDRSMITSLRWTLLGGLPLLLLGAAGWLLAHRRRQ